MPTTLLITEEAIVLLLEQSGAEHEGLGSIPRGSIRQLRLIGVPPKTHPVMNNPSMGALGDELNAHFVSNFYASFVQSLISKALCMAASEITKKQTFEHIAELSLNVKF